MSAMDQDTPLDRSPVGLAATSERPIGRERELDRLRALLRVPTRRLVTLTGPPGVGKTRLAMQAAADARGVFDGGVVVVGLAAVREAGLVVDEIARAIDVQESSEPLIERVARHLRGRRWLLVVDNVEHLPEAAPVLDGLVERCPESVALVTSRVVLPAPDQEVVEVPPLAVGEANGAAQDPWSLAAVRLFVRRADEAEAANEPSNGHGPATERTAANGRLIAEICRRLDGLPLAIELAAAHAPVLPLPALLGLLERRLPLLVDPRRSSADRHRTMRNAIAWSYELLPAEQQALFRRLAVFDGGFTAEAAAALARGWRPEDGYPYAGGRPIWFPHPSMFYGKEPPDHPAWRPDPLPALPVNVPEALAGLVLHHLVRAGGGPGGAVRYAMLETVREYGLEQLAASGEEAGVRHAHAVQALGLVEAASTTGHTQDHLAWLAQAEAELGNIRAALTWLAAQGEPANQLLLRLAESFGGVWQGHGRRSEARRWLDVALSRESGTTAARAWSKAMAGTLAWMQGEDIQAAALLEASLQTCIELNCLFGQARSRFFLALVAWRRGQHEQMVRYLVETLPLYQALGEPFGLALCQVGLAIVARQEKRLFDAAALLDEAYGLVKPLHFGWVIATVRLYGGAVALDRGQVVRAVAYWRESLDEFLTFGDPWGAGACVAALAGVAVAGGDPALGARLFGTSAALVERGDALLPPTEEASYQAAVAAARTALGAAAFAAAFAEGRTWSVEHVLAAVNSLEAPAYAQDGGGGEGRIGGAQPAGRHYALTDLQLDILRLLVADSSPKEIAQTLGISRNWVYKQRDQIQATLGVAGLAGLTTYAIRYGLVDLDQP
jgi:predicted ATPase/DNA-binding CsgD family transcriptional regulator